MSEIKQVGSGWLDQLGVIVLGETGDREHVRVSLVASDEGQRWLDDIPDAQREEAQRAVTSELAMAGMRIKQVLTVIKHVNLTGQTNG